MRSRYSRPAVCHSNEFTRGTEPIYDNYQQFEAFDKTNSAVMARIPNKFINLTKIGTSSERKG